MTPSTPSSVSELMSEVKARLEAATPGPWAPHGWSGRCHLNHAHGAGDCKYDYTPSDYEGTHHTISMAHEPIAIVITTKEYGALSLENSQLIANAPSDLRRLLDICAVYETALSTLLDRAVFMDVTEGLKLLQGALRAGEKLASEGSDTTDAEHEAALAAIAAGEGATE